MRSVVLACASLAALLAAAPAFANCTTDFGRVERNVQQLRNGPNTRAAIRELDRARAARSKRFARAMSAPPPPTPSGRRAPTGPPSGGTAGRRCAARPVRRAAELK
jgi:hypothetical protein